MREFKLGDKVILSPYCETGNRSNGITLLETMLFKGPLTIESVANDTVGLGNGYIYSKKWLLPCPIFQPGDKVQIIEELKAGMEIRCSVIKEMEKYAGKTVTIKAASSEPAISVYHHYGDDGYVYHISEDNGGWSWSSRMFNLKNIKYEDQLQRKEGLVSRGGRLSECGICYRRNKASITVGYLSKREITCR